MDARLWRQNVDDDPHYDPSGIFIAEGGFASARVCRIPLGADGLKEGQGWIGALAVHPDHQRKGVGSRLLGVAEKWLREKGVTRISLGGEPGHFFPGIPRERADAQAFFAAHGFTASGDLAHDLRGDIRGYQRLRRAERAIAQNRSFHLQRCGGLQLPALITFLEQNFPGRWLYETQLRLQRERSPQDIMLLTIGSRVVGFAHTYHKGSAHLGPSTYWRKLLGPQYGGLGPMGLSKDVRGLGLGLALLSFSVETLQAAGVQKMAVDWTTLTDFYGAAGFESWKQYRAWGKSL